MASTEPNLKYQDPILCPNHTETQPAPDLDPGIGSDPDTELDLHPEPAPYPHTHPALDPFRTVARDVAVAAADS